MEQLSGSNGNDSGKAPTTGPEPGYVTETRTAVKQGKGSLFLCRVNISLNYKEEAHLLLGI